MEEEKGKNKRKKVIIGIIILLLFGVIAIFIWYQTKDNNSVITSISMLEKIENGTATSKEIENYFKENKNDEEARSIYYYDCAKYYTTSKTSENTKGMSNVDKEKYYMMRISPEYNKTLSNEIVDFGNNLFGSNEEWSKQYETGKQINERQQKIYQGDYTEAIEIYNYIDGKYNEYYKQNGKEADEAYSGELFEEVANKFQVTVLEANDIWGNPIMDVEGYIKRTSTSTNTTKNTTTNANSTKSTNTNSYTSTTHYCDATGCTKKGTYTLDGTSGTEYYCYEHYKQMEDIVKMITGY